jgi:hypothetical protein
VVTGTLAGKANFLTEAGYRGARHVPLVLNSPGQGLENIKPAGSADDFDDRVDVLAQLEQGFARTTGAGAAESHSTAFRRALELMRSDKAKAVDLAQEPAVSRKPYGEGGFGQGCLLARRLPTPARLPRLLYQLRDPDPSCPIIAVLEEPQGLPAVGPRSIVEWLSGIVMADERRRLTDGGAG